MIVPRRYLWNSLHFRGNKFWHQKQSLTQLSRQKLDRWFYFLHTRAWLSGHLRGFAMSFFIVCAFIFASTTKTLKCIFYICTHKDIFLIITHVCNYYIHYYFYTYIHRWIHFIYTCFNIYIYVTIFPRHPTTWEGFFVGVFATKNYDQVDRFTFRGCSPGCLGIWSSHPQKSTYCWWFRNRAT